LSLSLPLTTHSHTHTRPQHNTHPVPGLSPALRARSALLGAGLGAAVGVPAALAQQALAGLLPEGDPARERVRAGAPAGMAAVAVAAALPPGEGGGAAAASADVRPSPGSRRTAAAEVAAHLEAGLARQGRGGGGRG
jgi:hypothetical protein